MEPLRAAVAINDVKTVIKTLHDNIGHMSIGKLKTLLQEGSIRLPKHLAKRLRKAKAKDLPCAACALARATKIHSGKRKRRALGTREWVMDIDGPYHTRTLQGHRWNQIAVSPNGMVFVADMHKKSHAGRVLREKKKSYEVQSNEKMEAIRTDRDPVYVQKNSEFQRQVNRLHIHHRCAAPDASAGEAENKIRSVQEKAKTLMIDAKAPDAFRGEAQQYAAALINMQPSEGKDNDGLSVFEVNHGKKPPLHLCRRWGAKCYAHIPKALRRKFGKRSRPAIFVGLAANGSEGYRMWCQRTRRFFHSRSVVFHEDILGWGAEDDTKSNRAWGIVKPPVVRVGNEDNDIDVDPPPADDDLRMRVMTEDNDENVQRQHPQRERRKPAQEHNPDEVEAVELVKAAERKEQKLARATMTEQALATIIESLQFKAQVPTMPRPQIPAGLRPEDIAIPKTREAALAGPQGSFWAWSLYDEDSGMEKNGALEWAKYQDAAREGKTVLPSMYIFSLKTDANGFVVRYKVRWVAKGYLQQEGKDYDSTFCPTPDWASVLTLVNLALIEKMDVHHGDVPTAFLIPMLEKEKRLFMAQAKGGAHRGPEWILRLKRCIYGLKQSGNYFNKDVHKFLLGIGFTVLHSDPCVYIHKTNGKIDCAIALFVDDFLIAAKNQALKTTKDKLSAKYNIKDLGQLSLFLGVSFKWSQDGNRVELSQKAYIEEIVETFDMQDCRPMSTPCTEPRPCSPELPATEEEKKKMEGKDYRKLIGMLRFASKRTRADIEFATSILARFQEDPRPQHWDAGMRIVAYLNCTKDYCLRFDTTQGTRTLIGFSDSDHAPRGGEADKRRSTTGMVFVVNGGVISGSSRKQSTTAKSTAEAELIALAHTTQEGVWLRGLFRELKLITGNEPSTLFCDNSATVQIAKNRQLSRKTKHLDVDYFGIREQIENNKLKVKKIASANNLSDIMTKPLGRVIFERLRRAIGVVPSIL